MTNNEPIVEPRQPAETPHKLKRKIEIAMFLFKYGGREFIQRSGLAHLLPKEAEDAPAHKAEKLKEDLEALGPTFVKLGQILSSRADLFPPEITKQLSLLEDKVEPFPFSEVKRIIEEELKVRLETLFSDFSIDPIGSASLGQVHTAVIHSGQQVAIKIQRPHILPVIQQDMAALRDFAEWFDRKTDLGQRYRFVELFQQFETTLMNELDYEMEASNLVRLKNNLREFDRLIVPSPIRDYCTKRVLTMDFVEGKKVTGLSPLALSEVHGEDLADALFEAYLKQVFVDGFFHADPHPGNVFLVDKDHLALIDLGMVGTFSPVLRRRLIQLLPAIYRQDQNELADIALEISSSNERVNPKMLSQAYGPILQRNLMSDMQRLNASQIIFEILQVSAEAGIHFPPEVSILARMLMHLDRVGRTLSPKFNPNQAIERHIDSIVSRQMFADASPRAFFRSLLNAKEFLEQLPMRANQLIEGMLERKLGFRVDVVPEVSLLENLEKIANRITVGIILASLIIGASQLMHIQTSFRLFGYPGFAMLCFILATLGSIALIYRIVSGDRKTHWEAEKKKNL